MKKIILVTVLCALLILSLSACVIFCGSRGTLIEDNESELILSLSEYLKYYNAYIYPVPRIFSKQIDDMRENQTLHIAFDASDFYFVCGYYGNGEDGKYYDNAKEYTWVIFEKAEHIREYYKDKKIVVAFQLDRASLVRDIKSDEESVPSYEYFQIFETNFEDGVNTNKALVYDKTFLYINTDTDKSTIYKHTANRMQCVLLDDQYYISFPLKTVDSNGVTSYTEDLALYFNNYYYALIDILIQDKYIVDQKYGTKGYYGLLEINQFAERVLGEEDFGEGMIRYGKNANEDETNPFVGGYENEQVVFDINKVSLCFLFGILDSYYDTYSSLDCEGYEIYFTNDKGEEYHALSSDESIVSEEYFVAIDDGRLKYSKFERIAIQSELFASDSGVITFNLVAPFESNELGIEEANISLQIYYARNGNTVKLSPEPLENTAY